MKGLFLMILEHLSVWFQLLWGFQKTVLFRSQYFDLWPPIFRVGVMKILFKPIFLDVFLDVDSESVLVFAFGASGSELWPFFWFWPLHRAIFLSLFFKKWKKKSQKWPQMDFFWIRIQFPISWSLPFSRNHFRFPGNRHFSRILGDFEQFQANFCVGGTRYEKTETRKMISEEFWTK